MAAKLQVGTTQEIPYGPAYRKGYGFVVQTLGTGPLAASWLTVAEFVYDTEAEAKKAEELMRQAIKNAVDVKSGP